MVALMTVGLKYGKLYGDSRILAMMQDMIEKAISIKTKFDMTRNKPLANNERNSIVALIGGQGQLVLAV